MIGRILGGRYEILEQIGGGGMALVYKARCQLLDRFVAVKVLKDEFVDDEEFVKKFRRESQAAARLSHPNIVNIHDVGVEDDGEKQIHYIVMEYIKGKTLKEIITEKTKLPFDLALDYSLQIAEALQNAHENHIFHRDIKPHNIMVTENNRLKVTDFGIARAATSSTVTTTSNVLGSVHYFSPEQARGGYTDDKSDIYSLGIVMYEMVTGKLPYDGESPITVALKHVQEDIVSPRDLEPDLPIAFENIILKSVEKRQADRYANIGDLIKDLRRVKIGDKGHIQEKLDDTDSHTRIMPPIEVKDEVIVKKKKAKKEKKLIYSFLKVVLLGVLLAFVLAAGIFFGYYKLKGMFTSEEVVVPYIIGERESLAKNMVEDLGLKFVVKDVIKNDNFGPGEVTSQSVEAGSNVKKGFPIEVILNEGEEENQVVEKPVVVPNTVYKDLADAREMILDAGLKIDIQYEYSDDIPLDVVIKQFPEGGIEVSSTTRVTLTVSQGQDVKMVTMEKLVGENIEEAKRILKRLDLIEGQIKYQADNEAGKDIVVWQSIEPGTELETKTSVDIYVSNGEKEDNNEDVPPEEEEDNNPSLETPISFVILPFQDREETTVIIIRRQDEVHTEVYNKILLASEGEKIVTLSGKAGAMFDIYYDGQYQATVTKHQ